MCSRLDQTEGPTSSSGQFYNSRHNDPTVIKLCQNVRLASETLSVKFQLDCYKITENFPIACVHFSTPNEGPTSSPGQFYNSRHNDPTVIKLCQNVPLDSVKLSKKFQLDCDKITEHFPIACVHVSTPTKARQAPGTVKLPT